MELLEDKGIAIGIAVFLMGLALALPDLTLGIFGFDFSEFPVAVITVLRIGLIIIAVSIGLKPIETDEGVF